MFKHEFTCQDMSCQHCVNAITKAIHDIDPQAQVKIALAAQKIWVDSNVSSVEITQAVQNSGYKLIIVS